MRTKGVNSDLLGTGGVGNTTIACGALATGGRIRQFKHPRDTVDSIRALAENRARHRRTSAGEPTRIGAANSPPPVGLDAPSSVPLLYMLDRFSGEGDAIIKVSLNLHPRSRQKFSTNPILKSLTVRVVWPDPKLRPALASALRFFIDTE